MKNSWVKKISVAIMLTISLGMVACAGNGGDFQDEEDGIENRFDGEEGNQGGGTEFFNGGSISNDGDGFVSVNDGSGGTFACDAGGCSLF